MNYEADFYATLLNLTPKDREDLTGLTHEDDFLDQVVGDYAANWRRRQKAGIPVTQIRRFALVRMTFVAVKYSFDKPRHHGVEVAFAMWLCERVERLAEDMARAELMRLSVSSQQGERR